MSTHCGGAGAGLVVVDLEILLKSVAARKGELRDTMNSRNAQNYKNVT